MSSVNRGVRFVKCPNCLNVLPENPNIPVYRCGGCGTVLRAKTRMANGENATVTSSEKQACAQSTVINDHQEKRAFENLSPDDDSNAGKNWFKREESFGDFSKDEIDEGIPELESLSSLEQIGLEGMSINTWSEGRERNIQTKESDHLNDMVQTSLKLYQQGHESMKISERMEDSEDSTDCEASPERDLVREALGEGDGNIVGDISKSRKDGNCNTGDPKDKTDLPESTFQPENQPDAEEKTGEDHLAENLVNYDAGAHCQIDEFNEKPSNENDVSNITSKFDLHSDEQQQSKYKACAGRKTSFDSIDFHSARNWMEQENDGSLRSVSKDTDGDENLLKHRHGNSSLKEEGRHGVLQTKILLKVDRLRDELTELFDKSAEKEVAVQPRLAKQVGLNPRRAYHQRTIKDNRSNKFASLEKPSSSCLHCETQISCRNRQCWHHSCSRKARTHDSKLKTMRTMEKRQKPKQHFRPVSGGTPFIICYNCFKLLQLPTDFLVSRKRLHRVQCGSCSEILLYSYRPKTRLANPRTPSEADNEKEIISGHERGNSHSKSLPRGDPISFSEEYGFSFGVSNSTEPDPPLYVSRNTSFNSRDDRSSSQRATGSRLHWLMGYSSASELLRQRSFVEHSENVEPKRVHLGRPSEEICARDGKGKGICWNENQKAGSALNPTRMREEDDSPKRSRISRVGLPDFPGILKKGIRELSTGLENMKLKST